VCAAFSLLNNFHTWTERALLFMRIALRAIETRERKFKIIDKFAMQGKHVLMGSDRDGVSGGNFVAGTLREFWVVNSGSI
jgi:hypothetical protein